MKKMLSIIISILICSVLGAQAQIWTENFTGQELKGLSGNSTIGIITNMSGITNWTVSGGQDLDADSTLNTWWVTNGAFRGLDVGVAVADWESIAVDVSAETAVTIAMDMLIVGGGNSSATEYFKVFYKLDGGAEQLLLYVSTTNESSISGTRYTSPAIDVSSATTISILNRIAIDGASDGWQFDNVEIAAGSILTNQPPVLQAIGNKTVTLNNELRFPVLASDLASDNDLVTLGASNVPSGATFATITNAISVSNDFVWASASPVGTYTTTFWVVDNDGSASSQIIIRVQAPPGESAVVLNEIYLNNPDTDDNRVYMEAKGTASASLQGLSILEVEGDGGPGAVDFVWNLAPYNLGANGLIILGNGYPGTAPYTIPGDATAVSTNRDMENSTVTFLLVSNFTGLVGDDLDTNDDGAFDTTPWDEILDSVGWTDGGASDRVYSPAVLTQASGTADAATRFPTNRMAMSQTAWYNGDVNSNPPTDTVGITYSTNQASANLPTNAILTPGDINFPQPAPDPNAPIVIITNPATASLNVTSGTTTYDLQGTCSTSVIGQLRWTNNLTGGAGTIAAATSWTISSVALNTGTNVITVSGTNNADTAASDVVSIIRASEAPPASVVAFFNEVECNGAGTDSNDFLEVIAPAGTNLLGCFIIHYDGSDSGDTDIWRFDFSSFVVPDDGITDTNGTPLGFCVIAQTGGDVANTDFSLPAGLQAGPDGAVLYDASSNILDAIAWGGAGDLPVDDPGTVITTGDPAVSNYLHVLANDSGNAFSLSAANDVKGSNGSTWIQTNRTPGAINGFQASGFIDITGGGIPNAPVLTITNPPAALIVGNATADFNVQGTCNTSCVGMISWTNSLTGGSGMVVVNPEWVLVALPLGIGVNPIVVTATNAAGNLATDSITIQRETGPTYLGSPQAFINEVEPNGAGADSNDFVEIIAPAGSNLVGCFLIHFNGADGTDTDIWRFDFPSFVVPDDGITDTNGVHLGFCVIADTASVVATDFPLPKEFQAGPDGVVLYDANSNILDAVAWEGIGDLTIDDPGTVFRIGDSSANNYLHLTVTDGADDGLTLQAPNNVLGDTGAGWTLIPGTMGAINGAQTSGFIVVTSAGGPPSGDTDGDGMSDDYESTHFTNATAGVAGADDDNDTFSNLEEYLADTIPNGPLGSNSFFEVDALSGFTSKSVTFISSTGRVYTFQFNGNLPDGNGWSNLVTDVPGTNVTTTLTDTNDPTGARHYRLRVRVP